MGFILDHYLAIILCSSFPLAGWILAKIFNKKTISILLVASLILLLPILSGYSYLSQSIYPGLIYIALSAGYATMIFRQHKTALLSILLSILTFTLALATCFPLMLGVDHITTDGEWEIDGYKVKHVIHQGFAGRPAIEYELYQYGTIPIFVKMVDSKMDNDTTGNCTVKFDYKNVSFNKCKIDGN